MAGRTNKIKMRVLINGAYQGDIEVDYNTNKQQVLNTASKFLNETQKKQFKSYKLAINKQIDLLLNI